MTLNTFWDRLTHIQTFTLAAAGSFAQHGSGIVQLGRPTSTTLILVETGSWTLPSGSCLKFYNSYRWTWLTHRFQLAHLRRGTQDPEVLVEFVLQDPVTLVSVSPYLCADDRYTATLRILDQSLVLQWHIQGPQKQTILRYRYV